MHRLTCDCLNLFDVGNYMPSSNSQEYFSYERYSLVLLYKNLWSNISHTLENIKLENQSIYLQKQHLDPSSFLIPLNLSEMIKEVF